MTNADLKVESLTVRFGGLVAVDDVSLCAGANTVTGLIGPNGAGKTTTFNACTGLNSPDGGAIYFGDRRLDGHSSARRARRSTRCSPLTRSSGRTPPSRRR